MLSMNISFEDVKTILKVYILCNII